MVRYYFHVRRGEAAVLDREGVELADLAEAVGKLREAIHIEASEPLKVVPSTSGAVIVEAEPPGARGAADERSTSNSRL
jgi:Domain of unknown function (DUF6894)